MQKICLYFNSKYNEMYFMLTKPYANLAYNMIKQKKNANTYKSEH